MPSVALNDIDHMRESVCFYGPGARRKLSRLWILLILASVIAAAGVVLGGLRNLVRPILL